jgi:hypothetical protein
MTLDEALVQLEEDVALLRIVARERRFLFAGERSEIQSASSKIHGIYQGIEEYMEDNSDRYAELLTKLGVPGYE